jgi:multidrug efflux system membrane fusion protein
MGQQGPYLFVVKADQSAEYRLVTPGMRYQQHSVVEQGLKVGEKVVTDGQMLIDAGAKVVERNLDGVAKEKKQP